MAMTTMIPTAHPYERGAVVLVLFPNTDLRSAKHRPVVVIQATNLGTGLPQYIVAMISSNLSRAGHPSRVLILKDSPDGAQAGILTDSVVMTDNIATIATSEITRQIGSLTMEAIDSALRHTLAL